MKQRGKSKADKPRYTPRAAHPYSFESALSFCDSDCAGSGLPRCGVGSWCEPFDLLLLKRIERKRRARADRWNRKYSSALCWKVLGARVLAECCVDVKKVLRKGAVGRGAKLLVACELPDRRCSVQRRATRVFIESSGPDEGAVSWC